MTRGMSDPAQRIRPYLGRLYRFGLSLARDDESARELVQATAVKALGAGRVPRDEPAFRAWLFRILRNAFLDARRRDGRTRQLFEPEIEPDTEPAREYGDLDERFITQVSVRQAFEKLSAPHREVLALVNLAGLSYGEAAEALGVPVGTVMSRVSRARRAMIAVLDGANVVPLDAHKARNRR